MTIDSTNFQPFKALHLQYILRLKIVSASFLFPKIFIACYIKPCKYFVESCTKDPFGERKFKRPKGMFNCMLCNAVAKDQNKSAFSMHHWVCYLITGHSKKTAFPKIVY